MLVTPLQTKDDKLNPADNSSTSLLAIPGERYLEESLWKMMIAIGIDPQNRSYHRVLIQ